jgi:hypothetical protein
MHSQLRNQAAEQGLSLEIFRSLFASIVRNLGDVNELQDSNLDTAGRKLLKFKEEGFRHFHVHYGTVTITAVQGFCCRRR